MKIREIAPRAPPPLSDYGLVGDGHSVALVSSDGSVDWWCPPRFDAPSVFARLLDARRGGHFVIAPPVRHLHEWGYQPGTAVLEARLWTEDAEVVLRTFMPHAQAGYEGPRRIVREVVGVRGSMQLTAELAPGFDYGRAPGSLSSVDPHTVLATHGDERLRLATTAPLEVDGARAVGTFDVREGERHVFLLDHGSSGLPPAPDDVRAEAQRLREDTLGFWKGWIARCRYEGPYREQVARSLLTLKLLQHASSGSFVAAATASLPESLGGGRNWDYRYSWLRDGAFVVMAFETAGYDDEALAFRRWLARVLRRDAPERIQMLYRVDGSPDLDESSLEHLEGYRGSRPVRIGNAAAEQRQLDTLGELMLCFHRADAIFESDDGPKTWEAIRSVVDWVCDHWEDADSGMWEMRGRHRQYVYSKAMASLALRHGLDIARRHGFDAPEARWTQALERVEAWVKNKGYDSKRDAFVQTVDRSDLDASNLLMGILGFLDAEDAQMRATAEAVAKGLVRRRLVHRYAVDDELPGNEGAFLAASFWLAEVLAQQGDPRRAREFVDAALAVAGPTGILPEEADPHTRTALGNVPQALSHLALVTAAWAIGDAEAKLGPERAPES